MGGGAKCEKSVTPVTHSYKRSGGSSFRASGWDIDVGGRQAGGRPHRPRRRVDVYYPVDAVPYRNGDGY